eukprot:augustus_masked-scaffold_22-processed-gene-1.38-mRNA-1 protein AED:0.01 eAED:0.01 QI:0/-1/0/1/-1/1/1/0/1128
MRITEFQSTSGTILNIAQNDCERVRDGALYGAFVVSSPVIISVAIGLAYRVIGVASFAGFFCIFCMVPLQSLLAKTIIKVRVKAIGITDERVNLMSEILNAAQLVKMYGWEGPFSEKIAEVRNRELQQLRKTAYLKAVNNSFAVSFLLIASLVTFATHTLLLGETLTAATAFGTIALYNAISFPLSLLAMGVRFGSEALVALGRIEKFLVNAEFEPHEKPQRIDVEKNATTTRVFVKNAKYKRSVSSVAIDMSIQKFEAKAGELTCVVGKVGEGKTSFLTGSLLGNMRLINSKDATVQLTGSIAYVSQHPWVFNATVRENILMGRKYDSKKYREVVRVSCLEPDLAIFPAGSNTELGERGLTVSGGQKTRVSLARALYADADVYILDDILSAVDANVSELLFNECIQNFLVKRNKCVILATHAIHVLPLASNVVVLKDMKILAQGNYNELLNLEDEGLRDKVLESMSSDRQAEANPAEQLEEKESVAIEREISVESIEAIEDATEEVFSRVGSEFSVNSNRESMAGKLIQAEDNKSGAVSFDTLKHFIMGMGGLPIFVILMLLFWGAEGAKAGSDTWLNVWTSGQYNQDDEFYVLIYFVLVFSTALAFVFRGFLFAKNALKSSTLMHNESFASVISAKMSFFYVTQIGMILNRFTGDLDKVDVVLVDVAELCLQMLARVCVVIILISAVVPWFLILLVPMALFYKLMLDYCRIVVRQVKRLESVTKTPLVNHYQSTLQGIVTIKAYEENDQYMEKNRTNVETTLKGQIGYYFVNRWIGIRLDFLSCTIITSCALFSTLFADRLGSGLAGLILTNAMQTSGILQFGTRQAAELEGHFTSVERLRHFTDSTPRESSIAPGKTLSSLPPQWPEKGGVSFVNYSTRYREGLPLVLNQLSLQIKGGEKVALTGRTGSGKSSTLLSMFRIIEASSGSILIDGIDIASIPLVSLRKQALSIVPQDAVMFSGTVRTNLDPFNDYSDDAIWASLEQVNLAQDKKLKLTATATGKMESNGNEEAGLEYKVTEAGANLSKGQRQLFCFARALLKNTKIICVDEGTSSVDEATDSLIQETLRRVFASNTLVVIAHRLNTVKDMDKIFVLDNGRLLESGSPDELIAKPNGAFAEMWQAQAK